MYNRGLDYALRTKLRSHLPKVAKKVREDLNLDNLTEQEKKSIDIKK